jgi:hypothetical protein
MVHQFKIKPFCNLEGQLSLYNLFRLSHQVICHPWVVSSMHFNGYFWHNSVQPVVYYVSENFEFFTGGLN